MNSVSKFKVAAHFPLVRHASTQLLACAVAQRIAELSAQSILARGEFRLALAGGETPRLCYRQLRELPLDWSRIHVYFGDERCLPLGDAQRNDSMARDTLLSHVPLAGENIHLIPAEQGAQEAAHAYAQLFKNLPPLDLVLLGMGEDGHTASLFPSNPANVLQDAVVPVFDAPKPPPERVSLSMRTLQAARHRLFMVAGSGKRDALAQIMQGVQLPALQVGKAEWHVESAALPEDF